MKLLARYVQVDDKGNEKVVAEAPLEMRGKRLATPTEATLKDGDKTLTYTASFEGGFASGRIGWRHNAITLPAGQLSKSYPVQISGCNVIIQSPLCALPKSERTSNGKVGATAAIDPFA